MIPHHPLSADTPETTITLALYPTYITDWIYKTRSNPHGRKLLGHYWGPAGARTGHSGLVAGPGFRADASDFPPGTRLTVTARLELPGTRCHGTTTGPEHPSPATAPGTPDEPPAPEPCRSSRSTASAAENWQHGDVVLAADGRIWARAHPDDQAQGWPWTSGAKVTVSQGQPYASAGGRSEGTPVRPLALLVRNGRRWTA